VSDPKSNDTKSETDVWGRTVSVTAPTGPGLSYSYDVLGQLTSATKQGATGSPTTSTLFYDRAGRKIEMSDPDMGDWRYQYDALGNLVVQIDAKRQATNLYYDGLNRLKGKIYINGPVNVDTYQRAIDNPAVYDVTYTYDSGTNGIGRRTGMKNVVSGVVADSTTWSYDKRGRMLTEQKTINGKSQPFTTRWDYNSADLPVHMTYPDNEKLTYNYDNAGNLLSLTSDIAAPATTVYAKGMHYDEAVRMTSMILGNGVINRSFTYYPWKTTNRTPNDGLLHTLSATSGGNTVQSLGYQYDKNGNVHQINNTVAGETSNFVYDTLNRLTRASASIGGASTYDESFDYDANTGNLLDKGPTSGPLLRYFYADASHPHAVTALGVSGLGPQQYWYDANGNMTQRLENTGLNRYLNYDVENRLVSVTQQITPSPTHTSTKTSTSTFTNTSTITSTTTLTPSPSPTGTMTLTATITSTLTDTPSPTGTMTPSPTVTGTETPSPTGTVTETPTLTATPTALGPFVALSAGWSHACGLAADGVPACWGLNDNGQAAPPSQTFTQVSAGAFHTCALKTDGTVACWGLNDYGQSAPPSDTFTQVSAGGDHTCGIKSDGSLACWGADYAGQATPPGGTFTQVSAGWVHTCAIKDDGALVCWGANNYGQSSSQTGVFTQVSAGWGHTCAIRDDSTLACWGLNTDGQSTPPSETFAQISAGAYHNCGLRTDGTLACWGRDDQGQSSPPVGLFTQVSAGSTFTCALKPDGARACWGNDDSGQLGFLHTSGFRLVSYGVPIGDKPADAAAAKTATRTRTPTKAPTKTITKTPTVTITSTVTATPNYGPTPTLAPFTGASYLYDADGNMVKSTVNGVATYHVSRVYQVTGAVITKYYGSYAMRVGAVLSYLLSDHLNSTNLTLNDSGQVVAELRYKAFGEIRFANGPTPTDHRYTSQRQQADLGLYYYGARWYDPYLGRFAQADTMIPSAGSSPAYDRYAYVANNPLRYVDPTGHDAIGNCGGNSACIDWLQGHPQTPVSTDCQIGGDNERYCNLGNGGFVDEGHYELQLAQKFWKTLQAASDSGSWSSFTFSQSGPAFPGTTYFRATYKINGAALKGMTDKQLSEVGLGIWIDFQQQFEQWQSDFYSPLGDSVSAFHMEDIPSTYLAYLDATRDDLNYHSIVLALGGGTSTDLFPNNRWMPVKNSTIQFYSVYTNTHPTNTGNPGFFQQFRGPIPYPEILSMSPMANDGYWSFASARYDGTWWKAGGGWSHHDSIP
jgi:RHS repeat-associated protein